MAKLSTKHCPDCESKNIVHLGKGHMIKNCIDAKNEEESVT